MPAQLPVFFTPIQDETVLLFNRGSYTEASLYHRQHELYAKFGRGFIKLHPTGKTTSKDKIFWQDITLSSSAYQISKGKLIWNPLSQIAAE